MKYSAINIGPIVDTLSLARKPRELWSASFLFSFLMKCIYEEVEEKLGSEAIISPAKAEFTPVELNLPTNARAVGLYPDRIYFKGKIDPLALRCALRERIAYEHVAIPFDYFNTMCVTCEAACDAEAIRSLNAQMDALELFNVAPVTDAEKDIVPLLKAKTVEDGSGRAESRLFEIATGTSYFKVKTLYDIARAGRTEEEKSYDRYVCIVQADGDNVGKAVCNPAHPDGKVLKISKAMLEFGKNAARMIDKFGGMPLYAGGDDLLFIAPVIGKDRQDIFQLVQALDVEAFKPVKDEVPEASLSFGISCSFVKYPLYEALGFARDLLFVAAKHWKESKDADGKTIPGPKNVIAWNLRKHSGGSFDFTFSMKDAQVMSRFRTLVSTAEDNEIVSALAHKLRDNEGLLKTVLESKVSDRLDAFFDRTLEFQDNAWFRTVRELIPDLYASVGMDSLPRALFGMLRTAKFLHGEPVREDEFVGD